MFQFSQRFDKGASGTEVTLSSRTALNSEQLGTYECTRKFPELSMAVCLDGIAGAETWSIAVMLQGSQEFKTLATALAKTTLYQIPHELVVQKIKVTLSGAVACTVVLSARALSSRNYG